MLEKQIKQFTLQGFYPYVPFLHSFAETGGTIESVIDPLSVTAPISVYRALEDAGVIDPPFFEQQSLNCEWVSNRWWSFHSVFEAKKIETRRYELVLHDLDFHAHIYFNGEKIGEHSNMFVPFRADVTESLQPKNELIILLEHAPDECGQIGYTSRTKTQKPRFNYKWDWCMRMVGVGIGACELHSYETCRISSILQKQTFHPDHSCSIQIAADINCFKEDACLVQFSLFDDDRLVCKQQQPITLKPGANHAEAVLQVEQPRLWWPNGHGSQPLYRLCVDIASQAGHSLTSRSVQIGLRDVQYLQNEHAPANALPYRLEINGKNIYVKGVNFTPLEMNSADITVAREYSVLQSIAAENCNLIRVWGGGYIGSDTLYDICDKLGILVWQEFPQSSSGVDNVPSKDPSFLADMEQTVAATALRLQTHPSLVWYSGGNELSKVDRSPVDFSDSNIALIQRTLSATLGVYQGTMMLPSSASGPNYFLDVDKPGLNHDVHGPWKYEGTTTHYATFNRSDSLFHSEFGVDGAANLSTLQKILSKKHLHATSMAHDIVWRHLGEMWDTFDRTEEIFGTIQPDDLEAFIALSQYIQAEGLRYALEANRRRAFQNSGSIIWQFNEPRPNVSGTNLEDYYGEKKLAYFFVKDAFRQVDPSVRYDKLLWNIGETCTLSPVILNEGDTLHGVFDLRVSTFEGKEVLHSLQNIDVEADRNRSFAPLSFTIENTVSLQISLKVITESRTIRSEYLLLTQDEHGHADREAVLQWLKNHHPEYAPKGK